MRRCRFHALLVWLCLQASGAQAEVYRCEQDGLRVYSDRPCGADAEAIPLAPIGRMPAQTASPLEGAYEARRARQQALRRRANQAWLDAHQQRRAREAAVRQAQFEKRVIAGMSEDEVRRAIGSPDEVRRSGASRIWLYTGRGRERRLRFEAGRLVRPGTSAP